MDDASVIEWLKLSHWATAVLVPLVLLGLWATVIEPDLLAVRAQTITVEDWSADTPPLKIGVISDLHVGSPHIDLAKVSDVVQSVNDMQADLIVLLGDYVTRDGVFSQFVPPEEIAQALTELKAPLGVIAVLGNHDWWFDGLRVRAALEDAGIVVLENNAVALPNTTVWVAGVADDMTRTPNIPEALRSVPATARVVLLSHDPAVFPDVPRRVALTLAGHTHGGQVQVPFFGPLLVPGRTPIRYAFGHVNEFGKDMYVSGGIGTSILPVRFNMRPGVALITLVPKRQTPVANNSNRIRGHRERT